MKDGSKENIRVSVVIPSYQPGDNIMHCLASVYDQTFDLSYEVIVVDSSPKNPAGYVHDKYPDVRMFHLEKRTLSGRARSMGALKARGDVVFFTDTDCVVDPNWMNRLWKSFQKGYFVSGGSIVNGTPGSRVGTSEYLLEFNEMNPHANAGHVKALPSCNLAVKKEVFNDVGYFPDFMKGEDILRKCDCLGTQYLF